MHLVTAENRESYAAELRDMHAQRKRVFIDQMGWPLPCEGALEFDSFDTDAALYLLHFARDGRLIASARLLRTDEPHLLDTVFAHLCEDELPRGDTVWEATRFCPAPDLAPAERRALLGEIIAGIIETGLLYGMTQVTFVASAALRPLALAAGWSARPLGKSCRYKRERVTACAAAIDTIGLRRVRETYGLSAPLLRFQPARRAA
jgi:N-acyl-L-homoserine lactone synthetase